MTDKEDDLNKLMSLVWQDYDFIENDASYYRRWISLCRLCDIPNKITTRELSDILSDFINSAFFPAITGGYDKFADKFLAEFDSSVMPRDLRIKTLHLFNAKDKPAYISITSSLFNLLLPFIGYHITAVKPPISSMEQQRKNTSIAGSMLATWIPDPAAACACINKDIFVPSDDTDVPMLDTISTANHDSHLNIKNEMLRLAVYNYTHDEPLYMFPLNSFQYAGIAYTGATLEPIENSIILDFTLFSTIRLDTPIHLFSTSSSSTKYTDPTAFVAKRILDARHAFLIGTDNQSDITHEYFDYIPATTGTQFNNIVSDILGRITRFEQVSYLTGSLPPIISLFGSSIYLPASGTDNILILTGGSPKSHYTEQNPYVSYNIPSEDSIKVNIDLKISSPIIIKYIELYCQDYTIYQEEKHPYFEHYIKKEDIKDIYLDIDPDTGPIILRDPSNNTLFNSFFKINKIRTKCIDDKVCLATLLDNTKLRVDAITDYINHHSPNLTFNAWKKIHIHMAVEIRAERSIYYYPKATANRSIASITREARHPLFIVNEFKKKYPTAASLAEFISLTTGQ